VRISIPHELQYNTLITYTTIACFVLSLLSYLILFPYSLENNIIKYLLLATVGSSSIHSSGICHPRWGSSSRSEPSLYLLEIRGHQSRTSHRQRNARGRNRQHLSLSINQLPRGLQFAAEAEVAVPAVCSLPKDVVASFCNTEISSSSSSIRGGKFVFGIRQSFSSGLIALISIPLR
jgi:hypothetical protein